MVGLVGRQTWQKMFSVSANFGYGEARPKRYAQVMKPIWQRTVGCAASTALVLSCFVANCQPASEMKRSPEAKRVLVVSVTAGFRHSAIPTGERILAELAQKSGAFTVEFVRQPEIVQGQGAGGSSVTGSAQAGTNALKAALEKLSLENLKHYDAVIFNNTTGELPLPDKTAFLDWIAAGHGFVGIHAATDTFRGHKPLDLYVQMVGAEFASHGPQVAVEVINQDPAHPACRHLPRTWRVFDEIYLFNGFDSNKVHCLLGLDNQPNTKQPGYYPVAWCKQYGKGRVFYTSLGHREDVWDPQWQRGGRMNEPAVAEAFQKHLLGGILWALGLEPGGAEPQKAKAAEQ